MSHHLSEKSKLSELYGIDEHHEGDLKSQLEQIEAFEAAAEAGDWKLFRQIVSRNGKILLKLMRSADGDARLRLPLFQSGELEERFNRSLESLNRDWTHLMPWWARLGYRFEAVLTWISVVLASTAVYAAVTGNPGPGGILGVVAVVILIVVDNAEPGVGSRSRWWVRFIYPKPRTILNKWRALSYIAAISMILWFMLAPTFKTPGDYCDGLSPAELAVYQGCGSPDPFAN